MSAAEKRRQPISTGSEWTFELIRQYDREIARIAERYALDTYPNQIEVITAEQMMDAYASVGMPLGYHHWSYGKHFLATEKGYSRGQMGLAYEIVINSDPCIAYLMEENTICMQALVIAHACYGHNSFFKGNYLFRTWTDASSIIDYLVFAKQYIMQCEERHGIDAVEELLDSCHALMNYGVDRYKRPYPISAEEERRRQKDREEHLQKQINDLWRTIPKGSGKGVDQDNKRWPAEPQENILYFLEKHAPLLEPWQREVVRIVRKIAQYFYPQRQTQVMNEGWATFWHYTLMNDLYDEGLVTEGFMMEFLQSHTGVVYQPGFDSPYYSGINPYTLGFAIYSDLRRLCEKPTEEDKRWFPDIAGSDWLSTLKFAMANFKDESFILQFLSPKVIRDLKLFSVLDDDQKDDLLIPAIHDEPGYRQIRETLAAQYNLGNREPNIQIFSVDRRGDRSLTLRHYQHDRKPLGDSTTEVLKHLHRLWGFDIHLESIRGEQVVGVQHVPPRHEQDSDNEYPRLDLVIPPICSLFTQAPATKQHSPALSLILRGNGGIDMQIYKVGGAVRDRLLGREVSDIDWVVVGATAEAMQAQGFRPVGSDFPVFLHPSSGEEYALARTERKSGKGYGGFTFHASPDVTLEEDLIRRDLTINAMAEDDQGRITDPYGGQRDLAERVLRHVSPAFAEDPLRVLRVARFAARYAPLGFRVADETLALMRQLADSGELEALTPERSWKEISRALLEPRPDVFIQVLRDCGALAHLLPELDALFGIPQPEAHHPEVDTGTHCLMVLQQCALHEQPLTVRWACLLHDLGKGRTPESEWPRHIAHEHRGLKLIDAVNRRCKVPKDCAELALLVGEYHTHSHRALELRANTLLELLQSFDVYRRPQRFEEFFAACEMDARGRLGLEQRDYPQAAYLRGAMQAARAVAVQPLVERGLKGAELGEALKGERLKALKAYKTQAEA